MAKIRFEGEEQDLPDGSKILEACEELGVPFGCQDGVCGTCIAMVVSGADNLDEKTEKERDMDLKESQRLACQCSIKSGIVEISVD